MARYRSPTAFEFVEEPCHDLSAGGMFIQSPLPAALGTLLKLVCEVDGGQEAIRGVARVVWHREEPNEEGPRGMGVKFVKLEPGSRELIDRLLARLGAGSIQPEAEAKAQERRSLVPGPRASQAPAPRTSQAPAARTSQAPARASQAPAIEAPAPPPVVEAPAPPSSATADAPVAATSSAPSASMSAAEPGAEGREPTQDRPKKARAGAANLRERLERGRRSHEEINTHEVLAAAGAARAANDTAPDTAPGEAAANSTDEAAAAAAAAAPPVEPAETAARDERAASAEETFTTAEAVAAASDTSVARAGAGADASAFEAHEVAEPVPSVQPSNWPRAPGGLAVKIAMGVLLGYLVILFSSILNSDDDKVPTIPEGATAAAPVPEPPPPAVVEAPPVLPPPAEAVPTDLAAVPADPAVADPAAPVPAPVPVAAADTQGMTYVVDVISTPEGARVSAGARQITAPGRLNLGALDQPVKLLAELDGYSPTATLVERAGFELSDGVMRRHIFLKLSPSALKTPRAAEAPVAPEAPAPAPAPAIAAPTPAAAPAEPAPAPVVVAPAAVSAAPAAAAPKPAASKPASSKGASPLETAMACLAQGDNACVIKALEGKAKSAAELELLIETYRSMGRTDDAKKNMELYVKRFPSERRAATYRRLLDRREAEANAPPAAEAPAAPAPAPAPTPAPEPSAPPEPPPAPY